MFLIDTHSHIYLDAFEKDIDDVIGRACEQGVGRIILPNIDAASMSAMHELSGKYPDICISLIGLHPTHVKENYRDELETIYKDLGKYPYPGIGEIGIDLYWDKTLFAEQKEAFTYQLRVAKENNLPVVIHARESFREILDIVKKEDFDGLKGVFHAFTGNSDLAREITDLGYLLGIGGILTFKNSGLDEVVKDIDLKYLVLETDAPYLAPVPFRGKRNESSYVLYVAEKLAEIKKNTVDEIAAVTSENAKRLFRL